MLQLELTSYQKQLKPVHKLRTSLKCEKKTLSNQNFISNNSTLHKYRQGKDSQIRGKTKGFSL